MVAMNTSVGEAVKAAQRAGWGTRLKAGMVQINPPGLDENNKAYVPIVIDYNPDAPTLRDFRLTAKKFGLIDGATPITPAEAQRQALAQAQAKRDSVTPADREAAARKEAEIIAANKKIAEATAAGRKAPVVTFTPPVVAETPAPVKAAPKTAVTKVTDGWPEKFEDWMLAEPSTKGSKLQLAEGPDAGGYFCPECFAEGVKKLLLAPQGLTAHRAYKHTHHVPKVLGESTAMSAAVLPENVRSAVELMLEELGQAFVGLQSVKDAEDAERQLGDVKAKLAKAEADLVRIGKDYTAANTLATQRATALAKLQAEKDSLALAATNAESNYLRGFEVSLRKMRQVIQSMSPVQAVGEIDKEIDKYLDK